MNKPIHRRRLGDAFDEYAKRIGVIRDSMPDVEVEELPDDLRKIVDAAHDLARYRLFHHEVVEDLQHAVAHELAQRALELPEHPESAELLMDRLQIALAEKRRSTD